MICVIPRIHEDELVHENGEHMKQVSVFIKTLFHVIYDDEINDTLDTFWSEYQAFNIKNVHLMVMISSGVSKKFSRLIVIYGIRSILCHVQICLIF